MAFQESQCSACGLCLDLCPRGAIKPSPSNRLFPVIDFAECNLCGQCIAACPQKALTIYGQFYTISQIMEIIEKNRYIYRKSGGGITCTGGEPLLQANFLQHLLEMCYKLGIHTAVETCGYVDKEQFQSTLANINWLFFDLKNMNDRQHVKLTGKHNGKILNNLMLASQVLGGTGRTLVIRQVVVPGINADTNIIALAEFATRLPHLNMIELLPYHPYGVHKYRNLGRTYELENLETPMEHKLKEYQEIFKSRGISCKVGGL